MNIINKHKALIITFLLTGIVVFGMFSIQITKQSEFIAESLYEIEPKTENELEDKLQNSETDAKTNKAFNEDEEFKKLMKNFKMVPSNDFEKTTKKRSENTQNKNQELTTTSTYKNSNTYAIKESDTEKFNRLKDLIDKKTNLINTAGEHSKNKSTLTYSLKNRTLLSYNTPRYLCERFGKVVVNIRVNQSGEVFDAYINGSSNTNNQCLIDHALDYAKSVRFDTAKQNDQLGSITFYFKGK